MDTCRKRIQKLLIQHGLTVNLFLTGVISGWTANTIRLDRKNKVFLPYSALEFQISKKKLINDYIKLALQSRDMDWKKEIINLPEGGDFASTNDWLMFYFE